MGFLNSIKKMIIKPKSLEEQRLEKLEEINSKIYAYFLLHTKEQVPALYKNNKTKCNITMAKELCIPNDIDFDDDQLSYFAITGATDAMNKLKIEANISRIGYQVRHSDCVIGLDWS